MKKALIRLQLAVELLKIEFRRALLHSLGVDKLVKQAFHEGWRMHSETDEHRAKPLGFDGIGWIDQVVHETRTWRSVEEAWQNSDAQEEFE